MVVNMEDSSQGGGVYEGNTKGFFGRRLKKTLSSE